MQSKQDIQELLRQGRRPGDISHNERLDGMQSKQVVQLLLAVWAQHKDLDTQGGIRHSMD